MKKIFVSFLLVSSIMTMTIHTCQTVHVHDKEFEISISKERIAARVKELGTQIRADYQDKKPIFIGVLNGAVVFLSDLIRETQIDCEIDFVKIASYGDNTESSGEITLSKNVSRSLTDRDVILVEDIIDSGLSIAYVHKLISDMNPRSIRIAALLDKKLSHLTFPLDYIAFEIDPEFVIGYGLDYAQVGRNLKDVYRLKKS